MRKKSKNKRHAPLCSKQHYIGVKLWKQREYPSTDEWIRKKLCIYTMEYTVLVDNTTPKDRPTGNKIVLISGLPVVTTI